MVIKDKRGAGDIVREWGNKHRARFDHVIDNRTSTKQLRAQTGLVSLEVRHGGGLLLSCENGIRGFGKTLDEARESLLEKLDKAGVELQKVFVEQEEELQRQIDAVRVMD